MKNYSVMGLVIVALTLVSFRAFSWTMSPGQWGSSGPITAMYIYPSYAIILQGPASSGPAGCQNDNSWSFNWSDFTDTEAARIQSMLLAAYMAKTNVQAFIASTGCGPENKKKFTGMLLLAPN